MASVYIRSLACAGAQLLGVTLFLMTSTTAMAQETSQEQDKRLILEALFGLCGVPVDDGAADEIQSSLRVALSGRTERDQTSTTPQSVATVLRGHGLSQEERNEVLANLGSNPGVGSRGSRDDRIASCLEFISEEFGEDDG